MTAALPFLVLFVAWVLLCQQVLRDGVKVRLTDFEMRMRRLTRAIAQSEIVTGAALLPFIVRTNAALAKFNESMSIDAAAQAQRVNAAFAEFRALTMQEAAARIQRMGGPRP